MGGGVSRTGPLRRFQAVKVQIFGGFPVENPTKKANCLKALLRGIALSEYGSEGLRARLGGLSEYGSVAFLVERPTTGNTGRTVLGHCPNPSKKRYMRILLLWGLNYDFEYTYTYVNNSEHHQFLNSMHLPRAFRGNLSCNDRYEYTYVDLLG